MSIESPGTQDEYTDALRACHMDPEITARELVRLRKEVPALKAKLEKLRKLVRQERWRELLGEV